MTQLNKLKVSLTKHGAHKLSILLRQFKIDDILSNLDGSVPGVNIELAQAKKNLSVNKGNTVPFVWKEAKDKGNEYINSLVLVGIIFSHYKLIEAMQHSSDRSTYCGTIERGKQLDGKAFTNFAHTLDELGFATTHTKNKISYDLSNIFKLKGFSELAKDLLRLKLETANWDEKNGLVDEVIKQKFHDVFAVRENSFRSWLQTNPATTPVTAPVTALNKFQFKKGHNLRQTGTSERQSSAEGNLVRQEHNEIQNILFKRLSDEYGESCVGTENPTGEGTFIDVIVKTESFCWFYEIKTANTAKTCIREAIPQLLEYAYWKELDFEVNKLIIIAEAEIDQNAEKYLEYLRDKFGLPLHYQRFVRAE